MSRTDHRTAVTGHPMPVSGTAWRSTCCCGWHGRTHLNSSPATREGIAHEERCNQRQEVAA